MFELNTFVLAILICFSLLKLFDLYILKLNNEVLLIVDGNMNNRIHVVRMNNPINIVI